MEKINPLPLKNIRFYSTTNNLLPDLSPTVIWELQFSKGMWLICNLLIRILTQSPNSGPRSPLSASTFCRTPRVAKSTPGWSPPGGGLPANPSCGMAWGWPGRKYLQEQTGGGQPGRLAQDLQTAHRLGAGGLSPGNAAVSWLRREKIASRSSSLADWSFWDGRRGTRSMGLLSGLGWGTSVFLRRLSSPFPTSLCRALCVYPYLSQLSRSRHEETL